MFISLDGEQLVSLSQHSAGTSQSVNIPKKMRVLSRAFFMEKANEND